MRSPSIIAVVLALVSGCLGSPYVKCGDRICPLDQVCAPSTGGCVYPDQLTQCEGQPDGTPCDLRGTGTAACTQGVCLSIGCGNGVVESSEVCDDGNTTAGDGCSATCDSNEACGNATLDLTKGEACDCGDPNVLVRPAGCNGPNSDAEGATCLSDCTIRGCGDLVASGLEDCDGADLRGKACTDVGYYGGTLGCLASCRYDLTACTGTCGDGVLDGANGESCDQTALDNQDCTDFGFYAAAGLACNALCRFDTAACSGRCGDGIVNGGEQCEPTVALTSDCTGFGFYSGTLACTSACTFDTSSCSGQCGDSLVNGTEQCETGMLGGKDCTDFGFYQSGGLSCTGCVYDTSACVEHCGDGVGQGAEACDGNDLRGKTCLDLGFYASAGLACGSACGFDTSGCTGGTCGDGVQQASSGELCDTTVPAGTDCRDFGYYDAKPVSCTSVCAFDLGQCTGYCGDGITNGGEDCEPTMAVGSTCQMQGFYAGTLGCTSACRFDVSSCSGRCGDGVVDAGNEQCEAGVLGGKSCTDFGFYQASGLACSNCFYDTSSCQQRCGDGIANGPEACDATDLKGRSCTDFGFYAAPGLACSASCGFSLAGCGGGTCGDGMLQASQGEVCDGSVPAGYDCTDFGYYGTSGLACNSICQLDDATCSGGRCGDHLVNGGETCDMGPPADESCLAEGYDAGLLSCTGGCDASLATCRHLSFVPEYPGFAGTADIDGFAEAGGRLYAAVGVNILESTGGAWHIAATFSNFGGGDIWAASATEAFAVTYASSTPLHRVGGFWQPMPTTGLTEAAFHDVWGTSTTNVYAVGQFDTDPGPASNMVGRVARWNGSSWTPSVATGGSILQSIWGTGPNDIYAVGSPINASSPPPFLHYNGTWQSLSVSTAALGEVLVSISGSSANDIVVGGSQGIHTWNGSGWTKSTCVLNAKVHARAGRGAYAIGQSNGITGGAICYRAGNTWVRLADALPDVNATTGPIFITENGQVLAGRVGELVRSGGAAWKTFTGPTSISPWNTIWALHGNEVYAAGGTYGSFNQLVQKWDGAAWTGMGLTTADTFQQVLSLWGFANGANPPRLFAVGNSGRLSTFNGATWSTTTDGSVVFTSVWGPDANNVWAVGTSGRIRKWTGAWQVAETSNTTQTLNGVFGLSSTDVWAVGAGGTVLHNTGGTTWAATTLPGAPTLNAVWARAANDVYAVGARSGANGERVIYRYNGASWSPMPIVGRGGALVAIWGTTEGDVLAAGDFQLLQLVGSRWIPITQPGANASYTDLFGGSGYLAAAGYDGGGTTAMWLGVLKSSTPNETGRCRDYWDNDYDGAVDCADSDCASDAWCSAGGSCRPTIDISCGQMVTGTTVGGPTKRSAYACGIRPTSGPEAYYRFTRPAAGSVTVTLAGYSGNLDLVVAGEQNGACAPDVSCVAASQTDATSEVAMFSAGANTPYTLIVDGLDGASSAFTLLVTCN